MWLNLLNRNCHHKAELRGFEDSMLCLDILRNSGRLIGRLGCIWVWVWLRPLRPLSFWYHSPSCPLRTSTLGCSQPSTAHSHCILFRDHKSMQIDASFSLNLMMYMCSWKSCLARMRLTVSPYGIALGPRSSESNHTHCIRKMYSCMHHAKMYQMYKYMRILNRYCRLL